MLHEGQLQRMNFLNSLARRATTSFRVSSSPFLIAICGWADTGKSTLAGMLCEELQDQGLDADWMSTDAFLLDREIRNSLGLTGYNPASIDADEIMRAIAKLTEGSAYEYYPYVNRTGTRSSQPRTLNSRAIVVIEGIHSLHFKLLPHLDYKVFIDAPVDVLKDLRIQANMKKRDMSYRDACRRVDFELEEFERYTAPERQHVDCVLKITRNYDYTFAEFADPA
jgi:uridine kinase